MPSDLQTGAGDSPRFIVRFVTTVESSVDARDLLHPRLAALDPWVDAVAALNGVILVALAGWPPDGFGWLGVVLIGMVAIRIITRRTHPVLRLILKRYGSLIGKRVEVSLDDGGVLFDAEMATTFIPWASITAVRSSTRTVAFFRDALLLGYVPATAFASHAEQAAAVAFASERIGRATTR